jgi:hypothetical protein
MSFFSTFTILLGLLHGHCQTSEGRMEVSPIITDYGVASRIVLWAALVSGGHVLSGCCISSDAGSDVFERLRY